MRRLFILLGLATGAFGQQQLDRSLIQRTPTAPREAGVYHVVTGTWSRPGATANLGPDVIYNASKPSGYFATGWEGQEGVDEGKLPGTAGPWNAPQDFYFIDGFEFGYCSQAGTVSWEFRFYDSYVPCDLPDTPANCLHRASDTILIPGAPTAGACWLVTIDLSGGGEFCMQADGGPCHPGYQGAASQLDSFGWGAVWSTDNGGYTGPLMDGYDPAWAPPGEGTCYSPSQTCSEGTTGLGAEDVFAIGGGGPVAAGCYWFQGYVNTNACPGPIQGPQTQYRMVMYTDCGSTCSPCEAPYCADGLDQLGRLELSTCSLASGPWLEAKDLVGGQFAYLLVGAGQGVITDPPGATGDLCLGGAPIGRYVADAGPVVGLEFSTDLVHGATGGGTGQLPSPPGGSLLAGQTWNFQTWVRVQGGSRFTPALTVTFEN